MKIDKKISKELLDYTWTLEEQMRSELLENFMKLSAHKSEVDKIRDKLMEMELMINRDANTRDGEKINIEAEKGKFYSILCNLYNNLEDDLKLDLKNGEHGYKTYEYSHRAVRKNTRRILNRAIKKAKPDEFSEVSV